MAVFVTRQKIQRLLGVELPADAAHLHYHKWQPSPELSYYTAYIKFAVSPHGFLDLMARMQATPPGDDATARAYLPAAWQAEMGSRPDWWDPTPDTPDESAAKAFGANGRIVAKHERGWAYLIVTDTGHSVGGDGRRRKGAE